tara:strand:- start:92 stop:328 length:237 start_codon:yes stop_codon:yes gene_type:complete
MSANNIEVELYNGSGWLKVSLTEGATVRTLLEKFGDGTEGGFIPTNARIMVGESVVDRDFSLNSGDKVAYSQQNKMGG